MDDDEIVVTIEGLDELEKTLTEDTRKAAMRFLRRVEKKAAAVFQQEAERTAPIDTGFLAEHIVVETHVTDDTMEAKIGPTKQAYYGRFQEFGTKYQAGRHWLQRAYEASKEEALQVFIDEAKAMLEELAAKKQ